jgi:hypothetical protein
LGKLLCKDLSVTCRQVGVPGQANKGVQHVLASKAETQVKATQARKLHKRPGASMP